MSEILIVFAPLRLCSKTKFSWNVFILLQSSEIYFTALEFVCESRHKITIAYFVSNIQKYDTL